MSTSSPGLRLGVGLDMGFIEWEFNSNMLDTIKMLIIIYDNHYDHSDIIYLYIIYVYVVFPMEIHFDTYIYIYRSAIQPFMVLKYFINRYTIGTLGPHRFLW
jgi:hypothetical protein